MGLGKAGFCHHRALCGSHTVALHQSMAFPLDFELLGFSGSQHLAWCRWEHDWMQYTFIHVYWMDGVGEREMDRHVDGWIDGQMHDG